MINTHNGYVSQKSIVGGEGEFEGERGATSQFKPPLPSHRIPPIDINEYPTLKKHLDSYFDALSKRSDKGNTPYNLRNCAYVEEFARECIAWQRVTQLPSFVLAQNTMLLDSMAFLTASDSKITTYLLGFLNSRTIFYYFSQIGHLYSDKGFLLSNQYVERFPIPKIDSSNEKTAKTLVSLVEKIILLKEGDPKADTKKLENEIDELVFTLYGLSEEEIQLISNNSRESRTN